MRHALLAGLLSSITGFATVTTVAADMTLLQTIPLPGVAGRIDHLALDAVGNRLFVAEHDNGTLDFIDLAKGVVAGRLDGLSEPQGVVYLADAGLVVVGSGGDGSVRFFDGLSLAQTGIINLDGDADNVRVGPEPGQVVVGYGLGEGGGLAVIAADGPTLMQEIPLPGHPESFQIDPDGGRIYVNVPSAGGLSIVTLATAEVSALSTEGLGANFPMALGPSPGSVAIAFRSPPKAALVDATKGVVATVDSCADADDIFVDASRARLYVICGEGLIDILGVASAELTPIARVSTAVGARTGLFDAPSNRLFVAAPARDGADAMIMVLQPGP